VEERLRITIAATEAKKAGILMFSVSVVSVHTHLLFILLKVG
jgi:hypothetical protein